MMPRCVYRCWGNSETLYIGSSNRPATRMLSHSNTAPWYSQVVDVIEVWYATQEEGYAAERRAIALERPRHNLQVPVNYPAQPVTPIGQWNPDYLNAPGMAGALSRKLHADGVSFYRVHRALSKCLNSTAARFLGHVSIDVNEIALLARLLNTQPGDLLAEVLAA